MSDQEKKEKVVTKYDRKMQRRQAEKEKEAKQKKINTIVGIVVAVAIVAFIASFPIRTLIATQETFITINGEKITRVEFDYNYNTTVNNYINQYGAYLGYMGLDVNSDFATQEYSENLTWKDNFEEMTVDNMKTAKALKAEAEAVNFQYDASKEVAKFKENVKTAAKNAKVSTGKYVKQAYGEYATLGSISKYAEESAKISAYLKNVSNGLKVSDEEIQKYYNENADDYDCVDYYIQAFEAEVAEDASEEQIEAAMEVAANSAYEALERIAVDGEFMTAVEKSDAGYAYSDWLFDVARKQGDTVTLPDEDTHTYYAIRFDARYLYDEPTVNARVITTDKDTVLKVMEDWNSGDKSEDSFIALWEKYGSETSSDGGLFENLTEESIDPELAAWLFADARQAGELTNIVTDSAAYVVYYVSEGQPAWKASISDTLLSQAQNEFIDMVSEKAVVDDAKGNLNYLKVQAMEEAEALEEDAVDGEVSDGDTSEGDAQ